MQQVPNSRLKPLAILIAGFAAAKNVHYVFLLFESSAAMIACFFLSAVSVFVDVVCSVLFFSAFLYTQTHIK
jgi:hypothetical protein